MKKKDEIKTSPVKAKKDETVKEYRSKEKFFGKLFWSTNVAEIITWLGDDFYALTTGKPIKIGDTLIHRMDDQKTPPANRIIIMIEDRVRNRILVAQVGDVIMRSAEFGYLAIPHSEIDEKFVELEDDVE